MYIKSFATKKAKYAEKTFWELKKWANRNNSCTYLYIYNVHK